MADLEYAFPPQIYYEQDLWKIKEILRESHAKLIFGSNFDREIADEKLAAFCNVSFPASRTVLNKTYAGYRGVISLVEDGAFSR
ncbi:Nitrogenase component 1 type Oxidoreductase [compost metagenome]